MLHKFIYLLRMDHLYSKGSGPLVAIDHDHNYCQQTMSPAVMPTVMPTEMPTEMPGKRRKRKLNKTSSIRRTPPHPMSLYPEIHNRNISWTEEQINHFRLYVLKTPRGNETLMEYWKNCAYSLNNRFHCARNGHECKGLAKRLCLKVPDSESSNISSQPNDEASTSCQIKCHACTVRQTNCDASSQTDLSLPVDLRSDKTRKADWIFIEPKRELKDCDNPTVHKVHDTASQRLREYAPLTDADKAALVDVITNGNPRQIARTAMGIHCLGEELKNMFLFDIEMDAKECANKGSTLYCKDSGTHQQFKWDNIISEIIDKQQLLAEVLLSVCLPRDRIGITSTTESLVPVLGMLYGILMRQRYSALNAVQKQVTTTLDNEQTRKKVYEKLQPLGVTLSHQAMLCNRKTMSGSSNTNLVDCPKDGK